MNNTKYLIALLKIMRKKYWWRLFAWGFAVTLFRLSRIKITDGIVLPFFMISVYGKIGCAIGLKFLVEIAVEKTYSDFYASERDVNILYDIGANCGYFAVIYCLKHPTTIAFCFEPHPNSFIVLEKNVIVNKLQYRVHCINTALAGNQDSYQCLFQKILAWLL